MIKGFRAMLLALGLATAPAQASQVLFLNFEAFAWFPDFFFQRPVEGLDGFSAAGFRYFPGYDLCDRPNSDARLL